MKRHRYRIATTVTPAMLLVFLSTASVRAQVGFGAGLVSVGEDVRKARGELEDVLRQDDDAITYDDISGEVGLYAKAGYKHRFGAFRAVGDLAYIYLQNEKIRLTHLRVNEDTTVSATFEVGTSLIPVSAGVEVVLPVSSVSLYAGAYPTYSFVRRTYSHLEGDEFTDVTTEAAGENELGLSVEGGAELSIINGVALAISLRYTAANMFSADDREEKMGNLLAGFSLWFGGGDDGDDEDDESDD